MRKTYSIRYLSTAEKDLDETFDYIFKDNPAAAHLLLDKFDKSISNLMSNPLLGVIPNDPRLGRLGYRMLIVDNYLVFYVIKKHIVQIRHVIHGARQYSFLF